MGIDINAIKELIKERFENKLSYFVAELKIDYSYMNQIMNGHKSPGSKKVCDKIVQYCKENNLDYSKYIKFF